MPHNNHSKRRISIRRRAATGDWTCSRCLLNPAGRDERLASADDAAQHLMEHEGAGHRVPFSSHVRALQVRMAEARPGRIQPHLNWDPSEEQLMEATWSTPLGALGLSLRARRSLVTSVGATCLGDLARLSEEQLRPDILGRATLAEVRRCLESWGLQPGRGYA